MAPISSSSGCEVVPVKPESGELAGSAPVPVWNWSFAGESRSSMEKKLASLLKGNGEVKCTTIVPPENAVVTGAEKIRVLTPPLLVTSASLEYELSPASVTVTVEAVGSIATVTKIVSPTNALVAGLVSVAPPDDSSAAVPMFDGL